MDIKDKNISIDDIDAGKEFNWGKTSKDYALYRDIYPVEFYQYILGLGLCKDGQKCLDVGSIICQIKNSPVKEFWNAGLEQCKLLQLG